MATHFNKLYATENITFEFGARPSALPTSNTIYIEGDVYVRDAVVQFDPVSYEQRAKYISEGSLYVDGNILIGGSLYLK